MGDSRGTRDSVAGRGLGVHIVVYLVANVLIVAVWALVSAASGASLSEAPKTFANPSIGWGGYYFFFPIYVMVFWGAALAIHAGIVIVGAPRRRRRRRARERRHLQASFVGALGDSILADVAVAGIQVVDGDKAAKRVRRDADRRPARPPRERRQPKSRSVSGAAGSDAGDDADVDIDVESYAAASTVIGGPAAF